MDEGVSKVGQDYARLIERLRGAWTLGESANEAADAIEQLLADNERMREALDEIADLAALSVVGGDDFDRGARAARLEAAEIARALNSIQTTGDHHAR